MANNFEGRYDVTVGRCGCMVLPDAWREALVGESGKLYVRPEGKEKCLCLIPAAEIEAELAKFREKALMDPAFNTALQIIGENTRQLDVEDGKIRIDKALLKSVGISGSAVAVGDGKMVKLWNPEEIGK